MLTPPASTHIQDSNPTVSLDEASRVWRWMLLHLDATVGEPPDVVLAVSGGLQRLRRREQKWGTKYRANSLLGLLITHIEHI